MPDLFSITTWRNMFTKHGQKVAITLTIIFAVPIVISFGMGQFGNMARSANTSTDLGKEVALINGTAFTMGDYQRLIANQSGQASEEQAKAKGAAIESLTAQLAIETEAKRLNARPDEADVDRMVAQVREQFTGKDGKEEDWRSFLSMQNMTANEFREVVAKQLLGKAVMEVYKKDFNITEEDAKNQSAEAKLNLVLVRNDEKSLIPAAPDAPKPLPDAEAKKKAETLLAQAKAGGDIAAIAKANSGDQTSKKGGDLGWRKEYEISQGRSDALGYGTDFDTAVHKAPKGQFTEIVKVKGFTPGYAFAKVVDRRNTLPKDFDAKKITDQLKERKASEKFSEVLQAKVTEAKVEIKDPDVQAYYDYFKWKQGQELQMQAQFAGMMSSDMAAKVAPKKEELDKLQTKVEQGFEGLAKRNPEDSAVSLIFAQMLEPKMLAKPAERNAIRDRLITLYEVALKSMEDTAIRRKLASYYTEKKQPELATKQYSQISLNLVANPPIDSQSAQNAIREHEQLKANFLSVNNPDLAKKEDELNVKLNEQLAKFKIQEEIDRRKQAEEKKKQDAETKKAIEEAKKKTASPVQKPAPVPVKK